MSTLKCDFNEIEDEQEAKKWLSLLIRKSIIELNIFNPLLFLIYLDTKATFLYALFKKDFLFMHLTSEQGQLAMKKIIIKAAT
jgi:hypothetical protein